VGTAIAEPVATREPDMKTSKPVVYGGLKVKEGRTRTYKSVQLIVDGTVRTYDLAQSFDGELPAPGSIVQVEFLAFCSAVKAVTNEGDQYTRRVESMAVMSMKVAKA
jgi:BioD-like phosphotransacetylase family protein